MTQQDDTAQGTPEQSRPLPSPHLDAGGSVPQAYLAPPQPGQPSYGSPAAYRPSRRSYGSSRQPSGQQGDGQPGYGQPGNRQPGNRQSGNGRRGYGRPGNARGPFGGASRRDPAIAAPWERLIASILDWIIIFVVSVLLFLSPLLQVWRDWQAITSRYPDLYSPAAQAAIDSISRDPATEHALVYWFLGMFGIALAYYWVQHAAWGATLGKRAMGTRVVTAADRSQIGVRAAGIRAVGFLAGPAAFLLLASPFSLAGGLLWLSDTALPLLDARAQCLHDKLSGTIVVRRRWLDEQARSAGPWS
jgi:uncharacterized RDD family membrane protein YckC